MSKKRKPRIPNTVKVTHKKPPPNLAERRRNLVYPYTGDHITQQAIEEAVAQLR